MNSVVHNHTQKLKELLLQEGFDGIAIAKAEFMEPEARQLEAWLNKGYNGGMQYMENHFDLRTDPRKLVPKARSVVSLLYNYYTEAEQVDPEAPKISMYALGKDYHHVIRKKLKRVLTAFKESVGEVAGRAFVDSAPVLERDWARRSGLGWVGKHTLLIHPRKGSYFFLAELILDIELDYDLPIKDHCGTCTRCIDACPTEAISPQGYLMDGSKCISYLTIELKESIPEAFEGHMSNYMYGCDICQQVCPWNRFSQPHNEPDFEASKALLNRSKQEWIELTEEVFEGLFKGSAVKRTKYQGLRRNIDFLYK